MLKEKERVVDELFEYRQYTSDKLSTIGFSWIAVEKPRGTLIWKERRAALLLRRVTTLKVPAITCVYARFYRYTYITSICSSRIIVYTSFLSVPRETRLFFSLRRSKSSRLSGTFADSVPSLFHPLTSPSHLFNFCTQGVPAWVTFRFRRKKLPVSVFYIK